MKKILLKISFSFIISILGIGTVYGIIYTPSDGDIYNKGTKNSSQTFIVKENLYRQSFINTNMSTLMLLKSKISSKPTPEVSSIFFVFLGLSGGLVFLGKERYNKVRRIFDILISIIAIIITFPLMLIAAILIKLDSSGPIFYKQIRVGTNRRRNKVNSYYGNEKRVSDNHGYLFNIYKLRSMRNDAESKSGPVWAKKNDMRITKIGKFLRKTRLDEIPQFINVLKGEMSIIGPRPERPVFVKELNKSIDNYNKRFKIKPGITGLAQVRYKYADTVEDTRKKVKYDLLYIKKMNIFMDAMIFLNTIKTVIFGKGAQ